MRKNSNTVSRFTSITNTKWLLCKTRTLAQVFSNTLITRPWSQGKLRRCAVS
jgi:hypothetical protein